MTFNSKFSMDSVEYWNKYYEGENAPVKPSSFAIFCMPNINREKTLLEFGCGNGRDSFFFAANGINVIALDQSSTTIEVNSAKEEQKTLFLKQDFTSLPYGFFKEEIGTVYSRFTLHSVDKQGYQKALENAYNQLCSGGNFFIEARTINDPIFGVGEPLQNNGFINTHYRRFLLIKDVISDLENIGFKVIHAVEDYTSSWYKDDHAVVLRIIAQKK